MMSNYPHAGKPGLTAANPGVESNFKQSNQTYDSNTNRRQQQNSPVPGTYNTNSPTPKQHKNTGYDDSADLMREKQKWASPRGTRRRVGSPLRERPLEDQPQRMQFNGAYDRNENQKKHGASPISGMNDSSSPLPGKPKITGNPKTTGLDDTGNLLREKQKWTSPGRSAEQQAGRSPANENSDERRYNAQWNNAIHDKDIDKQRYRNTGLRLTPPVFDGEDYPPPKNPTVSPGLALASPVYNGGNADNNRSQNFANSDEYSEPAVPGAVQVRGPEYNAAASLGSFFDNATKFTDGNTPEHPSHRRPENPPQIAVFNPNAEREIKSKRVKKQLGACACFLIVGMIVGIAVGISSKADPKQKPEGGDLSNATSTSVSPIDKLESRLSHLTCDLSVFSDESSPQFQAMDWLATMNFDGYDQTQLEARFALSTLYFATHGEDWFDDLNFLSNSHECNWTSQSEARQGVFCNTDDEVTSIIIDGNNLRGDIPEEIKGLSSLEEVRITNQTLISEPSLSGLTNVDALGLLPNLISLDLSRNQLPIVIPTEFTELSNLEGLFLDHNQFVGSIPKSLGDLTRLKCLRLDYNILDGNAAPGTLDLKNLEQLSLEGNNALIIPNLYYTSFLNLKVLNLNDVEIIARELPNNVQRLSNLEVLELDNTGLAGGLPVEIKSLTSLKVLSIATNALSGTIPWSSLKSDNLEVINFADNDLSGRLPEDIGRLSNLVRLDLSRNRFTGTISSIFGELTSLTSLDLSNNQMRGELPTDLGLLKSLEYINLEGNDFSGDIGFLCKSSIEIAIDCQGALICTCCGC